MKREIEWEGFYILFFAALTAPSGYAKVVSKFCRLNVKTRKDRPLLAKFSGKAGTSELLLSQRRFEKHIEPHPYDIFCAIFLSRIINMGLKGEYRNKILKDKALTAFQKKVLIAVLDIPRGEVRTYAWIAERIGSPKAARAVGNALSKNPYAPHVPCHRVIASDGSIGGYSGGVGKKRKLLKKENIFI